MFRKMRRYKQAVTEEESRKVMLEGKRGVLSVTGDEGYPYGIPMDYYYDAAEGKIYLHCAKEGHKIDAIKRSDKVCFTVWDEGCRKGDWSWYVTSVVAFCRAELVTDAEVTLRAVREIGLKYYPTAEEVEAEIAHAISRVQVIALTIEHMTGKLVHEK